MFCCYTVNQDVVIAQDVVSQDIIQDVVKKSGIDMFKDYINSRENKLSRSPSIRQRTLYESPDSPNILQRTLYGSPDSPSILQRTPSRSPSTSSRSPSTPSGSPSILQRKLVNLTNILEDDIIFSKF